MAAGPDCVEAAERRFRRVQRDCAVNLQPWVVEVSMKTLAAFLLVFVPFAAYADDCQSPFPILGMSGEEMHFQVTSLGRQTGSIVGLYSENKLIRTIVTRKDGAFTVGGLTEGKYFLYV